MSFNSYPRKLTSRAQVLVNLANGIKDGEQEDHAIMPCPDVFMSSSYDPTQNFSNIITPITTLENEEISVLEELNNVTYDSLLDPFLGDSEINASNNTAIESPKLMLTLNSNKKYYLDEVTGQLKEDENVVEENYYDGDYYYLDEKTGMLKLHDKYKEHENIVSETESLINSEEETRNRETNKQKRLTGQKYLGRKRKLCETGEKIHDFIEKPKKHLQGKPCSHSFLSKSNRSYLCGSISEDKRQSIFNYFWSLNSWDAKKAYLKTLVRLRPILRRRKTVSLQRQLAFDYFIPDDQNTTVKVCKSFFISTFNIHNDTLTEWVKKLNSAEEGKDLRSKHEKRQSKVINVFVSKVVKSSSVKEWLTLLNKVPSHYCRSSSTRVYVEDTFESKSHMFRIYTEWCKDNQKPNIGRKLFNNILEEEKISIYKPRKDQCDVCTAKKEGNISEEDYTLHIMKKEEAYKARIDAGTISSSEVLVLSVDVQSVLLCPKILVSAQYYKQKLQVHNQSIYIHNNKDVHLYVWHEGDGGVTANEFTSCLIHFIRSQLNYKKVIIISDGCSYQNKNKILSSALLKLTKETGLEIEQIILEKGHTMMQVDSVHSTLEKKFRPPIYTPSDYITRMREARPKQPYHIHHIEYDFFKKYEDEVCINSIRPGKKVGDATVNDIRALLYRDGSIFYKLRHPEDWRSLPQRVRPFDPQTIVTQLYNEPRKIDKNKYDSLQSLKPYMHRDYHAFYDNLKYED